MKRKKGATIISILLLVFIALALSASTLFVLLTNEKVEKIISDARFLEKVYFKEEQIKFFLNQNVSVEEAVRLIEGAKLVGEEIEITEELETKEGKINVVYRFKPNKNREKI